MKKRAERCRPGTLAVSIALAVPFCACDSEDDESSTPPPPPVDAATVPLLDGGNRVGVIFSSPAPAASAVLNAAFDEAINAGVDTYELVLSWDGIESSPGQIDVAYVSNLFDQFEAAGLDLYLNVLTIDTNQLQVPSDFRDPGNSSAFAVTIYVNGRVLTIDGNPIPGAEVQIWQANAKGVYNHPRDGNDPTFQGFGASGDRRGGPIPVPDAAARGLRLDLLPAAAAYPFQGTGSGQAGPDDADVFRGRRRERQTTAS